MISERTFRLVAFCIISAGVCALAWTKQDPTYLLTLGTYLLKSPLERPE